MPSPVPVLAQHDPVVGDDLRSEAGTLAWSETLHGCSLLTEGWGGQPGSGGLGWFGAGWA